MKKQSVPTMTDETLISACCSSRLRIDLANSTSARSQISAEDAHQKDVSTYRMQRASSAWARSSSSHQKRSSQKIPRPTSSLYGVGCRWITRCQVHTLVS